MSENKPDLMAELAEGHGVAILKDIRTGTQTVHMKPGLWRDIQKALKEKDERISQLYAENQRWQNEALMTEKWMGMALAKHGDLLALLQRARAYHVNHECGSGCPNENCDACLIDAYINKAAGRTV